MIKVRADRLRIGDRVPGIFPEFCKKVASVGVTPKRDKIKVTFIGDFKVRYFSKDSLVEVMDP